jgi:CelD/BcsL family acetyltransferase involved in cellulose biosynthesis
MNAVPSTSSVEAVAPVVRPGRPRRALQVELVEDYAGFAALEQEWDALVARTDDQPFYRHGFLRLWLEHFGADAELRVLTLRGEQGRLTAVLPMLRRPARMHGLPVRELCAAANLHSCRFDLVAEHPHQACAAFLYRLQQFDDWDVLRLPDVPEGGRADALLAAAHGMGLPAGRWSSLQSPRIVLEGRDPHAGWGSAKFRANLRRRRRRLQEKGTVILECIEGGPGWPATLGFYRALARHAAACGMLRLWLLRLDGRVIAFQFALEHDRRYLLLKPAYDESIGECSPGQLLMQDVLDDCQRRGLAEFDFLGPDMPWKRDWTDTTRPHAWLFVFRGARGHALHALKFRLQPLAREFVKRWMH